MAREILDITGQVFGKLKVKDRVENGKNGKIRWKCECNCGNEIIVNGADLKNNKIHSCGCISEKKYKRQRKSQKCMTAEEKEEWDELYNYVKYTVMNMRETQSLSRFMVVRLKGLLTGKFAENYNIENKAKYSLRTVINTFKYCSLDIKKAIAKKSFNTDEDRFCYIMAIVERNLNTVDERMKFAEKKDKELQVADIPSLSDYSGATYQRKTVDDTTDRFKDLW